MSVSSPFIQRPIATSLLGIAVMLGGMLGYFWLPVASLPQVDFPTIQVTTQLPGASPDTMAALVTAPLERQFGLIPSLTTMTSSSSFGISQITLQFDLSRDIDSAAQDVQAGINAAGSTLPRTLPYPPNYSKVNPADAPIVTLALTSSTISLRQLSDLADSLLAQRLSELSGVGRVTIEGNLRPAIRIQADLARLASYGLSMEDLRNVIVGANVAGAKGSLDGAHQSYTIAANDQISAASAYRDVVVTYRNQAPVFIKDVANVVDGLENTKVGGWYQGTPAVIVDIQRQPGANVIATVQGIQRELPRLQRSVPAGATLAVVHDSTTTIRASIHDVQFTLLLSIALVVMVVFVFLRTVRATVIAGVALPLSLIATFGVMWFCGFSLDNLSLMALTIGTGFVVDDAIVMIENIVRHLEEGEGPFEAALEGAREIGFTVISLTLSLIAVFIPLLFMTGIVGRMFREFALTLTIAVVTSAVVSLTLTPMMCSRLLRHQTEAEGNFITRKFHRMMDFDREPLPAHAGMGAGAPVPHPGGHARHVRSHHLALPDHSEGIPAAAGHRPHLWRDGGRPGCLLPRDAAAERRDRTHDPPGSGRDRGGGGDRGDAAQCHPERGPARHHVAPARPACRHRLGHHRPVEARGPQGPGHGGVFPAGAGHPDLDPHQPRPVPIYPDRYQLRRGRRVGREARRQPAVVAGPARRRLRRAERRAAYDGSRSTARPPAGSGSRCRPWSIP